MLTNLWRPVTYRPLSYLRSGPLPAGEVMAVATQALEAAVGPESVRLNTTNYFAPPRCHTAIFATARPCCPGTNLSSAYASVPR